MKKIFSLLAAVLFVSSVMATETITYVFSSKSWDASPDDWTSGKDGASIANQGVQVSTAVSGANATSLISFTNIKEIVVTYNTNAKAGAGSVAIQVGSNAEVSQDCAYSAPGDGRSANYTATFDYSSAPQSGNVKITVTCSTNSLYIKSVAITYNYDASAASISADDIDFGTVMIPADEDTYTKDINLAVTAENLGETPIAITLPAEITSDEATLPATGGTFHLHLSAASCEFSKTITLSAGTKASKEITVSGKIKQDLVLAGTEATMTKGTNAYDAMVDGHTAVRVGKSDGDGEMTISIPANAVKLRFFAAAWAGTATDSIALSSEGATLSASAVELTADAGIAGNSPFTLDALSAAAYQHEITLSNVTEATEVKLASDEVRRFAVWGATYVLASDPTALDNAASEQKTVKTIENGQLVIIRDGIRYNALGTRLR